MFLFKHPRVTLCFVAVLVVVIVGNNPTSAINEWCQRRDDCKRVVGNVECFYNRCRCQESNINVELFGREECVPIALYGPGSPCKYDVQCSQIMLRLSRCNKPWSHSSEGSCECYDTHEDGRKKTVYANGVCIYQKSVGERCLFDDECIASIGSMSRCKDNKCTKNKGNSAQGILPSAITVILGVIFLGSRFI